jgi:hypothetical protein
MTFPERNSQPTSPAESGIRPDHQPALPPDREIDAALARLNHVQPPSHFQQRLSARIIREMASPTPLPFYQRLRWRSMSLAVAACAAAFIGGVFARPLFHHAAPLQPAIASHPAVVQPAAAPQPVLSTAAQPSFNVRLANGHTAAVNPAGVVGSTRARNEHIRTQANGQPQDPTLGKLTNKPPRPGQSTSDQSANSAQPQPAQANGSPSTTPPKQ